MKNKPSKDEQRKINAQRAIDRANYQHKWYQKNRERILKKQKKKRKKNPEPPPETDSEDEHNKEVAMIEGKIEASTKLPTTPTHIPQSHSLQHAYPVQATSKTNKSKQSKNDLKNIHL